MNGDFGTVNPWYYPVTSSSPYQFYNPNFYHPPEYTPPPTPPHVYHHIQPPEPPYQFYTIPQPPPYYTPPTSYTSPYLSDSSGISGYSTNQHEIQARPNPYHPPLTCFTSPFITTTQFPFGVIDEQQPELVVSQVFDESPHSPELIFNSSNDNDHQMYDKFTEIIQKLEEIGKNLADQSRIYKEMSSKKVSQSSHAFTHVSIVSNLDKSVIIEKTGNVDSKQQLDILAPHMFDESPENEYVTLDKHFSTTSCAGQAYSNVESSQSTVVETSVESLNYDNRVFDVNSGIKGRQGIQLLISLLGLSSEQQQECAVIDGLDKKATRVCDEKVLIFDPGGQALGVTRRWRDVFWSVMFVAHLICLRVVLGVLGLNRFRKKNMLNLDRYISKILENHEGLTGDYWLLYAVAGAVATVLGWAWLLLLGSGANQMMKFSVNILATYLAAVFSAFGLNSSSGVLFLLFVLGCSIILILVIRLGYLLIRSLVLNVRCQLRKSVVYAHDL